jgi:cytidyltransferase-like protein
MQSGTPPTVLVSGCFDLLHSGHVAFLEAAARYGRVIVAIGSNRTITALKGQAPWCRENERFYLVQSLRMVESAFISSGSGITDFERELRRIKPDYFIVNEDGDHSVKRHLCEELGIAYVVLTRTPPDDIPVRSSSQWRQHLGIPYRIEIAGGWLDQPAVSSVHPGCVVVASISANERLMDRSGLATSSRAAAQRFWGQRLPEGDPVELAQQLFALENPPGTTEVAGSQDQLGILLPGVSRLHYGGKHWPAQIERITDEKTCGWLESVMFLVPTLPRPKGYCARGEEQVTPSLVAELARASDDCWDAIRAEDPRLLGASLNDCLAAQVAMFPAMLSSELSSSLEDVRRQILGAKFTGAGGGGYMVVVAETKPAGAVEVHIRRSAKLS